MRGWSERLRVTSEWASPEVKFGEARSALEVVVAGILRRPLGQIVLFAMHNSSHWVS